MDITPVMPDGVRHSSMPQYLRASDALYRERLL